LEGYVDDRQVRVFCLKFETSTPAFEDDSPLEVARVLQQVKVRVLAHELVGAVQDSDGTTIGTWEHVVA